MTISLKAAADGLSGMIQVGGVDKMSFGSDTSGQPFSFRNKIINGGMDIWQRATTQNVGGYGSVDRWSFGAAGGSISVSKGQDVQPVAGSQYGNYCIVSGTSVVDGFLLQPIEDVRTLAGRKVTLSFERTLISGSDTGAQPKLRQNFGTSGSANAEAIATSDTVIGTKRIITFDVPSIAGKTIGANSSLTVIIPFAGTFARAYWNFQLEASSIATAFEQRPAGSEYTLCLPYFQMCKQPTVAQAYGTNNFLAPIPMMSKMRAVPTIFAYQNGNVTSAAGAGVAVTSISSPTFSESGGYVFLVSAATGFVPGVASLYAGYAIGLSAEL